MPYSFLLWQEDSGPTDVMSVQHPGVRDCEGFGCLRSVGAEVWAWAGV